MGEIQNRPFQLSFNASLKVGFQGSRVTSDGSLVLVRELDERLGFGKLIEQHLTGLRGKNSQLASPTCCGRQSIVNGWLGRPQLRQEALPGPNLPADRICRDWVKTANFAANEYLHESRLSLNAD
jgi:hypothetical protein